MDDSAERYKRIQSYLSGYTAYESLIAQAKRDSLPDGMDIRARAFAIRRSVMRLPESREKALLYSHYIKGYTLEACAELIGVSRRTVFRLQRRAFEMYEKHNPENESVRVIEG